MRPARAASLAALGLVAAACAAERPLKSTAPAAAPVAAAAAADAPALEILRNDCRGCHTEDLLRQQRLTEAQWAKVLDKMHRWGAPTEGEDLQVLTANLAASYGRDSGPFAPERLSAEAAADLFRSRPDGALAGGNAVRGLALYGERCAPCHAEDGRGGPLGLNLVGRRSLHRADEFAALVRGGAGRMPGFETTDAEAADLLAYLRSLPNLAGR